MAAGFDWPAIPFVDDSLLLLPGVGGGTRAVASYPGLRLWPDAIAALFADSAMGEEFTGYSKKRRVAVPREKTPVPRTPLPDSLPLLALFLLNDPVAEPVPEIVIEPAAGAATLMELLRRCFLLDPGDPVAARRLWQASGDLLRAGVPVARLGYPRLHSYRPHLCERLLEYVDRRAASIDTGTVTD